VEPVPGSHKQEKAAKVEEVSALVDAQSIVARSPGLDVEFGTKLRKQARSQGSNCAAEETLARRP